MHTDLRGVRWGEYPKIDMLNQEVKALAHHPHLPQLALAQDYDIRVIERDTGQRLFKSQRTARCSHAARVEGNGAKAW